MQKISTFLWFDGQAEPAANFYVSIFKNSRIKAISRNSENAPGPTGEVLVVEFELDGMTFHAMNGGPGHPFSDAISLMVYCDDQAEVDHLWDNLTSDGGRPVACGWLTDKYGVSWQITPKALMEMIKDPDKAKVGKVMGAMMQMVKLDIAKLKAAYDS